MSPSIICSLPEVNVPRDLAGLSMRSSILSTSLPIRLARFRSQPIEEASHEETGPSIESRSQSEAEEASRGHAAAGADAARTLELPGGRPGVDLLELALRPTILAEERSYADTRLARRGNALQGKRDRPRGQWRLATGQAGGGFRVAICPAGRSSLSRHLREGLWGATEERLPSCCFRATRVRAACRES